MSALSCTKLTCASIDMTDLDNDNAPLTSTIDNNLTTTTLTGTRTPPNLASDWSSADSASGGWIDHGIDGNNDDDSDNPAEQEQFDRISGILSQLIQEANNAINSPSSLLDHQASTPMTTNDDDLVDSTPIIQGGGGDNMDWSVSTIDDIISEVSDDFGNMDETFIRSTSPLPIHSPSSYESQTSSIAMMERTVSTSTTGTRDSRRRSRLPRPKKLSLETLYHQHLPSYHNRSSSILSTSSSSSSNMDYDDDTLFSPVSSDLTTPMSRTISPLLFEKGLYTQLSRQGSAINNDADLAILYNRAVQNQQHDDSEIGEEYANHLQDNDALMSPNGSLMASFERLDSSLAIVDSLSRDLANYRRQHPRQHNNNNNDNNDSNSTDVHPMTITSHSSILTASTLDPLSSTTTNPAVETTTIPFDDDNAYTNQHYHRPSSGISSGKWVTLLMVCPILYIPYLLMASLWEQIIHSATTTTDGAATAPFSLLLSTASAMMFDDRHNTFASLKSTLITTFDSTAVIGNNNGIVAGCAGLAVFLLFLAILHLLKNNCATMDQDGSFSSLDGGCRQFMDSRSFNDRSKMIRRSSLPMMPCSPSLSRRNSF